MRAALFAIACAVSYLSGAPAAVTKAPTVAAVGGGAPVAPHAGKIAENAHKPAGHVWGRSVGSPTDGKLIGGSHLDEAPYLRVVPAYASGDVRWGTGPLVGLVDRAARQVRRQFADAVLSAGHLSRQGGGELDRHASHESGRDADIGFYVKSQTGKPLLAEHFVAFKGDGTAGSWPGAYFDDARNWALVSALVNDGVAHVTHIFVATPLRARLLAYAERVDAPSAIRVRAAEVMAQPHGALPHDDHFHVRIACPATMTGCIENPTAPKPRFARVPVPHGRSRGIAHASAPPPPPSAPHPKPESAGAAKPEPHSDVAPWALDETPAAIMAAPLDAPHMGAAPPAHPIDDVDGVLDH